MGLMTIGLHTKVKKVRFVEYESSKWISFDLEDYSALSIHKTDLIHFKNLVLWAYEDFIRKGGKP